MTNSTLPLPPPDTRRPYSPLLHALSPTLLFISFIIPPSVSSSARRLLFVPTVGILSYLLFCTTTGDKDADVGLGNHLGCEIGLNVAYILFCDPRKVFRLKSGSPAYATANGKDEEGKEEKDDGGPGPTLTFRFEWAFKLFTSPRGIGWTHEPSAHILPPRPSPQTSRIRFVFTKLLTAILCLLLDTVAYMINVNNPALNNPLTSVSDYSMKYRIAGVLVYASSLYAKLNIGHSVVSALVVGLGFGEPQNWPGLFGSVWEAWCVARFWSRTWHHVLRHTLLVTTNFLLPLTPARSHSMIYTYLRLLCAFLVSGLLHTLGEYMVSNKHTLYPLLFFILQPLAIAFERVIFTRLGVNFANKETKAGCWVRLLGYVWVVLWFTLTGPILLDPLVDAGIFAHQKGSGGLGGVILDWVQSG